VKLPGFTVLPGMRRLLILLAVALSAHWCHAQAPRPAASAGVYGKDESPAAEPGTPDLLPALNSEQNAYVNKYGLTPLVPEGQTGFPFHFFADGGFVMVHTNVTHNPAYVLTGPSAGLVHFHYDVNFGEHAAIGVVSDSGLGFRTHWWQLNEANSTPPFPGGSPATNTTVSSAPIAGLPGFTSPSPTAKQIGLFNDVVQFNNHLQMTTWDWEGFKQISGENWSALASGGMRYLYLSQHYAAFRSNQGQSKSGTTTFKLNQDQDAVGSGRNFTGLGPTVALEGRHRLGPAGFGVYANARGTLLFGRTQTQTFQSSALNLQTIPAKGATTTTISSSEVLHSSSSGETIPAVDVEVGVDWLMDYGRASFFVRAGMVSQTVFGSGSATNDHGGVELFGLQFTAGVYY